MARRVTGDLLVARRPDGGAVLTIKASTGEAIEIERSAEQVSELVSGLFPQSSQPAEHAAPEAQAAPAKRKAGKSKEDNINA